MSPWPCERWLDDNRDFRNLGHVHGDDIAYATSAMSGFNMSQREGCLKAFKNSSLSQDLSKGESYC
jgi:hypothetical protein